MSEFFKRLFHRHHYQWCRKIELYHNLSGETQYYVCEKCGKIKDTRFVRYD